MSHLCRLVFKVRCWKRMSIKKDLARATKSRLNMVAAIFLRVPESLEVSCGGKTFGDLLVHRIKLMHTPVMQIANEVYSRISKIMFNHPVEVTKSYSQTAGIHEIGK